jgi:hypothetical protein
MGKKGGGFDNATSQFTVIHPYLPKCGLHKDRIECNQESTVARLETIVILIRLLNCAQELNGGD